MATHSALFSFSCIRVYNISNFCYHIDKIECDFQAKIYDLKGKIKLENMLKDLKYYGREANIIKDKINSASDVWIEYDKKIYKGDKIFESLINDIQKAGN